MGEPDAHQAAYQMGFENSSCSSAAFFQMFVSAKGNHSGCILVIFILGV